MPIAVISHPACRLHDIGGSHPERPVRRDVIEDHLISSGLLFVLYSRDALRAMREDLQWVHDPA